MPIKIYWGPPGSYKSASAVWDDVIACAKAGRVLVTNMRGLTEQRVRDNLKDVADGFKVISLKNHVPEDLEKLRRWWHWAPFGAFLILDEVQAIYPPDWTAKELHQLDMQEDRLAPNGEALAKFVGLMFDMHRHGNWDMTFTTPSIKKVRPEIRAAAEVAYKHKNLAILGWRGRFVRSMHSAEDNGNPSDIYSTTMRKIPSHVFKLYESTATGAVQDSKAGINIFTSPRLLLLFGVLLFAGYFALRNPLPAAISGKPNPGRSSQNAPLAATPDLDRHAQGLRNGRQIAPDVVWRVSGVFEAREGSRAFLTASDGRVAVIDLSDCFKVLFSRWRCNYEGGVYNEDFDRSGQALTTTSASEAGGSALAAR